MDRKITYMFAGQGAQHPGMGLDLYETSSAARKIYDMGESIRPGTLETCFHGEADELTRTVNAQPCLFLTDLAAAAALDEKTGCRAACAAGFSLGEIAALAYAGVLSYEDAFRLVCLRGETMDKCGSETPGGMAAVLRLENDKVEELCRRFDGVYPVNYNCPGQIACAGKKDQIAPFTDAVKAAGGRAVPIAVSGAFHTPFMKECSEKLSAFLKTVRVNAPEAGLYSNMTGEKYPDDAEEICRLVSLQCSNPVRWVNILESLAAEDKIDLYVEVGAGKTLSGLCKKTLPDAKILNVADSESLAAAAEEIVNG